jgi:hypothetical protein
MKSNVAVVIDIRVKRAESHITRAICAINTTHIRDVLLARKIQKSCDCDRKYATRPVIDRAAAICIYTLLKSAETATSVAVCCDT